MCENDTRADFQVPQTRDGDMFTVHHPSSISFTGSGNARESAGQATPADSIEAALEAAEEMASEPGGFWLRPGFSPAEPVPGGQSAVFHYMHPDGTHWTGWSVHWRRN